MEAGILSKIHSEIVWNVVVYVVDILHVGDSVVGVVCGHNK